MQTWLLKKPRPTQDVASRIMAWMSAMASPGGQMLGLVPLLSNPWPHSWSKTAAISPVLRQALPLSRKKFTVLPFQKALQVMLTFMLAVSCACSQGLAGR